MEYSIIFSVPWKPPPTKSSSIERALYKVRRAEEIATKKKMDTSEYTLIRIEEL